MLLPVFWGARDRARATACISNEKQIGMAMLQYIQDNDEMLPAYQPIAGSVYCSNTYNPYTELLPYANNPSIFICPSDLGTPPTQTAVPTSYSVNRSLYASTSQGGAGGNYGRIQTPASVVAFAEWCDSEQPRGVAASDYQYMYIHLQSGGTWQAEEAMIYQAIMRHQGGVNYLECDGHARWFRPDQLDMTEVGPGASPNPAFTVTFLSN